MHSSWPGVSTTAADHRDRSRPVGQRTGEPRRLHVHGEGAGAGQAVPCGRPRTSRCGRHDRADVDRQPGRRRAGGERPRPAAGQRPVRAVRGAAPRSRPRPVAGPQPGGRGRRRRRRRPRPTARRSRGQPRAGRGRRAPAPIPVRTTSALGAPAPHGATPRAAAARGRAAGRPATASLRVHEAAQGHDREDQAVEVVVDVEVPGEAGAGELRLVPRAVRRCWVSTSQATPRADRRRRRARRPPAGRAGPTPSGTPSTSPRPRQPGRR